MTESFIRRIVTGHAADGRSIVTTDGVPPNIITDFEGHAGLHFTEVWRTSGGLPPIGNGPDLTAGAFRLATGDAGSTFRLVDFPASTRDPAGTAASDSGDFVSPMHRTESIDYGIVLSGEICLVLTDSELKLKAGDIVIQRGTDHAWANRSAAPARMAFILVAGRFADEIRPFVGDVVP